MASPAPKIHVRVAKPEEYGKIAAIARKAFIHDPILNYLGSIKQVLSSPRQVWPCLTQNVACAKLLPDGTNTKGSQNLEAVLHFFLRACHNIGGRVTVAVKTVEAEKSEVTEEEIVCAAFWYPPNKRIALWKVPTLLRSGIIKVLKAWGLTGLKVCNYPFKNILPTASILLYSA
jgi:hypothetical protein